MKRILISIAAIVGVGGLLALLTYHPKSSDSADAAPTSPASSPAAASPSQSSDSSSSASSTGKYKDGTYTGGTFQAPGYGPVQVQAVISGGKLTAVNFLQMPSSQGHSMEIASEAKPILLSEALQAQNSSVDTVSGATQDSQAFVQSLASALSQAGS